MKPVAITSVKFQSSSGDCSNELEQDLAELTKILEYHARQICQKHPGLKFEIEEDQVQRPSLTQSAKRIKMFLFAWNN